MDCIAFSSHIFSEIHRATSQIVRIRQVLTRFLVLLICHVYTVAMNTEQLIRLHRCEYHADRDDTVTLSALITGSIARSANLTVFSLLRGRF